MRFQAPVNVWQASPAQLATLQPGQWVYAGEPDAKGRFLGVKPSGTIVVAWLGNERNQGGRKARMDYVRTLRDYAKGH